MNWLTPTTALIAGAISVPLLVLMYFLRLKRKEEFISSTFLWKRAVQDLQVNAPFQRLRRNILLLLQLLAMLLILVALAGPILSMSAGPAKRYVLLIDHSASMNVVEDGQTRLAQAKQQANKLVKSLRGKGGFSLQDKSDQAMVVAFAGNAKVLCNFTSDKQQLIAAIDSITPTDNQSKLGQAITVARAFAQTTNRDQPSTGMPPAQLELFSDGKISDLENIVIAQDELKFHRIGKADTNIAVVSMQARRSYDQNNNVAVFATLANFGPAAVTCDVQLSVDGNIRNVRKITIPARKTSALSSSPPTPGTASVSYNLEHAQSGVFEIRQLQPDSLASDDAAWAIVAPPHKLNVLLVSKGNVALSSALRACPLAGFKTITPDEFAKADPATFATEQSYDVIVLDNCITDQLPRGRYLVLGQPPKNIGITKGSEIKGQAIVDWRSQHPALQFVDLTNLFVAKCPELKLPRDAEVLAEFSTSPAISLLRRKGSTFLLVGFDPMQTNWPFEPSFAMFCYNAINFLGLDAADNNQTTLAVGKPISVEGLTAGSQVNVAGPGITSEKIAADPSGTARFPRTNRTGIYTITTPQETSQFAVNLLCQSESDISPAAEIKLGGKKVKSQAGPVKLANIKLWPLLVAAVLFLVCIEWLVYTFKIKL